MRIYGKELNTGLAYAILRGMNIPNAIANDEYTQRELETRMGPSPRKTSKPGQILKDVELLDHHEEEHGHDTPDACIDPGQ